MSKTILSKQIPVTVYIYKSDPATTPGRQHELGQELLKTALINEGILQYELRRSKKGKPLIYAPGTLPDAKRQDLQSSYDHAPEESPSEICHASISHTAGFVVCALCADRPVGVDVEIPGGHKLSASQMRRTEKKLLKREFETEPASVLAVADEPKLHDRTLRFYERWTLAEAFGKMKGAGLAFSEDYDAIIAHPHETRRFENAILTVLAEGAKQESLQIEWKEISI